ncbi:hypothetical protein PV325_008996 [Microctonus aethiopoides]|nr:hypothetical protein PV325_008996 [Microctonus aethiopoides]
MPRIVLTQKVQLPIDENLIAAWRSYVSDKIQQQSLLAAAACAAAGGAGGASGIGYGLVLPLCVSRFHQPRTRLSLHERSKEELVRIITSDISKGLYDCVW